ncbi:hypothetical protein ABKA04_008908 [Annulohypoxylon sp. FPYF3050]
MNQCAPTEQFPYPSAAKLTFHLLCHRLKKQCIASVSARRHTAKRRGATRTNRLEEKLDELVSRLKAHQDARSKETEGELNKPQDQGRSEPETGSLPAALTPATAESIGGTTLTGVEKGSPDAGSIYLNEPPPAEAEELLKKFREDTIGFFPFMYIPPHVTAQQLRELYPFLWLNIMVIAQSSPRERLSLSDQARNIVVQRVVVNREKSLDLLLGLLALVGWAQRQRRERDKPFWTLFSQLIVTLICDLGLHLPQSENLPTFCGLNAKNNDSRILNLFGTPTHEVQRAVLGAFFLTSRISNIYKHAPGLRWSAQLDGYLENIAQESTVSQDETLIALVKMQLIINQLFDDSQTIGGGGRPPLYLSALRSQLLEITKPEKLGTVARNHPITLGLYHYTELLISDSAISKPSVPWNEPDMRRFEVYQSCLLSIQAFLDTLFAAPVALLESLPFTSYPQIVHVVKALHKITTIQDPAWDRNAVRKSIDLILTCDKVIATLEYLKASATLASKDGSEDETYNWGLLIFRKQKEAWQNELDFIDAENNTLSREAPIPHGIPHTGVAPPPEFGGDPWFSDMWKGFWE